MVSRISSLLIPFLGNERWIVNNQTTRTLSSSKNTTTDTQDREIIIKIIVHHFLPKKFHYPLFLQKKHQFIRILPFKLALETIIYLEFTFFRPNSLYKNPIQSFTNEGKNQCKIKKISSCRSSSLGVLHPPTPLPLASVLRISDKICKTFTPL